jgi:hypothetical protein
VKFARIALPLMGLVALAAGLRASDAPALRVSRDGGHLILLPPASVLDNADVKPRLTTGPHHVLQLRCHPARGAGRVAMGEGGSTRYEPGTRSSGARGRDRRS